MDRAETTGLGVAVAGHVALLAALTLGFANARLPLIQNDPIEVSFVDETGLESAAPTPSDTPAAPRLAEVEGPVDPETSPPVALPEPAPKPRPDVAEPSPAPAPKPVLRPRPPKAAAPTPAKAAPRRDSRPRPTGRLDKGLLDAISDRDSDSRSKSPPAKVASAAVQNSLGAEVRRQVKPHWRGNAPTGADAEKLRTILDIRLARSGAVTDIQIVETTGQTASNRPQVKLHQEKSMRAVKLAAPFKLPPEYYESWKSLTISFDKSLAQ